MKKLLTLLSVSFLLFSCTQKNVKHAEPFKYKVSTDFVQGSEDIPLLVGMNKMLDESLGFDSDSGSIMASSYETKIDLEKVQAFYKKTLPQMGWKVTKSDMAKLSFKREREKLEIEFVNHNGKDIVRFFISSAL